MSKIYFVLSEDDLVKLESTCIDKDLDEALHFVLKKVAPPSEEASSLLGWAADAGG